MISATPPDHQKTEIEEALTKRLAACDAKTATKRAALEGTVSRANAAVQGFKRSSLDGKTSLEVAVPSRAEVSGEPGAELQEPPKPKG